jgi:hypothetical protein
VDVARLRALRAAPEPDSHTFLLLQAAFLARNPEVSKTAP